MITIKERPLNKYIDHTLLKPEARPCDIEKLCAEAAEYDFYAVCVNSCYVALASKLLAGTDVKIASVIGFPLGASSTESKCFETEDACVNGAGEIDMVLNVGWLKAGLYDECKADIAAVNAAAAKHGAIVKVILETCLLSDEEIKKACELSEEAGAAFVKTSTGFSSGGAVVHHVEIMRSSVSDNVSVKASGGIRDYNTAKAMIDAGADRLGVSAGIAIIQEADK